ncbi:MAG: hypothetical protein LBF26_02105 [Puniceicoccales bacterium]|jgi:hypothetical protein|nr:hypothetical protein [Puniceicoccales bacterium]
MHTFEETMELGKFRYVLCGLCGKIAEESESVGLFFQALAKLRRSAEKDFSQNQWRFYLPWLLARNPAGRLSWALKGICVHPSCDFYLRVILNEAFKIGAFPLVVGAAKILGIGALTPGERQKLCLALKHLDDGGEVQEMAHKMLHGQWEDGELRQELWKSAVGKKNF